MVSSLLAGIHAPLVNGREGLMPESLTRRANAADVNGGCPASFRNGVRLHFGIMSGFASERRPASPGTASGIASEYPSGFNRISHRSTSFAGTGGYSCPPPHGCGGGGGFFYYFFCFRRTTRLGVGESAGVEKLGMQVA